MSESIEIKFQLLEAQRDLEKARKLCDKQAALLLRWNKAAAHAGMAGSEYVDDPERVFERVIASRTSLHSMLRRAESISER